MAASRSKPPWWKCNILYWLSLLATTNWPQVQAGSAKNSLKDRISLRSTENLLHRCALRSVTGDAVALSGKTRLCCNAKSSGDLIHDGISSAVETTTLSLVSLIIRECTTRAQVGLWSIYPRIFSTYRQRVPRLTNCTSTLTTSCDSWRSYRRGTRSVAPHRCSWHRSRC